MARTIRTSKRKLLGRTSGVNLYADQAVQVQAIMESLGEKREAPVLRILVDEALAAAAAVGDDRIQQQSGQRVNVDGFTHGSAAQRAEWFRRGLTSGDPRSCDTFSS